MAGEYVYRSDAKARSKYIRMTTRTISPEPEIHSNFIHLFAIEIREVRCKSTYEKSGIFGAFVGCSLFKIDYERAFVPILIVRLPE